MVPHLGHGKAPSPSIFVKSTVYTVLFLMYVFFIMGYAFQFCELSKFVGNVINNYESAICMWDSSLKPMATSSIHYSLALLRLDNC